MQKRPEKTKGDSTIPSSDSDHRLKNGTILSLVINEMSEDGFGIAHHGKYSIFVPNGVTGDEVTAHIDHVSKHAPSAWAQLMSVDKHGPHRKKHFCEEASQSNGRCGGCPLGHISKNIYRKLKIEIANDAFHQRQLPAQISEIHSGSEFYYRNKSNFVVHKLKTGSVRLGSFSPRSHRFAFMSNCKINLNVISKTQRAIEELLTEANVVVPPAENGLRYVTLKGFTSGAVLVDLVVHGEDATGLAPVASQIGALHNVHGVTVTCNSTQGNTIRKKEPDPMEGTTTLSENIGNVSLAMRATTFFQLNNEIAEKMYALASAWCGGNETIWDLYCGIGGLGSTAAKKTNASLFGCDNVASSIELANQNAAVNNVNAIYNTWDLASGIQNHWPMPNTVLVNPPRKGIDPAVLKQLAEKSVPKIIYMSCNPNTFAADAQQLCEAGYTLKTVEAFDMLPQTNHVELLGLFVR